MVLPVDVALSDQSSVLYAGDGYLNTKSRLNRFSGFFGEQRLSRLGVFQVMHHRARATGETGLPNYWRLASVFSAQTRTENHGSIRIHKCSGIFLRTGLRKFQLRPALQHVGLCARNDRCA